MSPNEKRGFIEASRILASPASLSKQDVLHFYSCSESNPPVFVVMSCVSSHFFFKHQNGQSAPLAKPGIAEAIAAASWNFIASRSPFVSSQPESGIIIIDFFAGRTADEQSREDAASLLEGSSLAARSSKGKLEHSARQENFEDAVRSQAGDTERKAGIGLAYCARMG